MNGLNDRCPFEVGQYVVYRPSSRGMALDVMSSPSQKLTPGTEYRVKAVQKGLYVVVEGHDHPGGGIYWTEFEKVN